MYDATITLGEWSFLSSRIHAVSKLKPESSYCVREAYFYFEVMLGDHIIIKSPLGLASDISRIRESIMMQANIKID
jgi:hypothetical protein